MESDGGIDKYELKKALRMCNIKLSARIRNRINEKFNELDTNKNGKLEKSEVRSGTGEDYFGGLGGLIAKVLPVLMENLPQVIDLTKKVLGGMSSGGKWWQKELVESCRLIHPDHDRFCSCSCCS